MSFKVPTVEEMEKSRQKKDVSVPSLFQSHRSSTDASLKTTSVSTAAATSVNSSGSDHLVCNSVPSLVAMTSCTANSSVTALPNSKATASTTSGVRSNTGVVIRPVTSTSESVTSVPARQPKPNSLIVSPRQRGNPILKFVRNVPWEFGDIVPDYQLGITSCALYLSLRYHNLKPDYIHERLRQLANSFVLRVLLVQVDVKDSDHALKELAKICILADCTMVLAFTIEEAGRYLETYKSFENKPPDMIMEKTDNNYLAQITDTLTSVKKVNKTDAITLLSTFGSLKKIVEASEQDLSLCPGLGPQKASRLHKVFNQPFLKEPKRVHQANKVQEPRTKS